MRIIRCYLAQKAIEINGEYLLSLATSHHLGKVLRLSEGANIQIFDGCGHSYNARLVNIGKQVTVRIIDQLNETVESPLSLHLCVAVGKGDKMDLIIQKAVELGVSQITPMVTQRVEVRVDQERWQKKLIHWQEIIVNACEQCGRNIVPQLNSVQPFKALMQQPWEGLKLILDPHATTSTELTNITKANLLIGPEGGFTDEEVALAAHNGFQSLLLGPRILRMETAAIAALAILQAQWGDMKR